MKRLILVADYDMNTNMVSFRSASHSAEAMRWAHLIESKEGHICAVGAIDYEHSFDKAYIQLKRSLKKKLVEKIKAKI
jgi:hypothetical protein